jgi:uncharacterized protein YjbI with pentapeptide repeats
MTYENEIFENVNLFDECEDKKFINCRFIGCIAEGAMISGCLFNQCHFEKCRIVSPKIRNCELNCATFENCSIIGVNFGELKGVGRFTLPIAKLSGCVLKYCTFEHMTLDKFDFSCNDILYTTYNGCSLRGASLKGSKLTDTVFYRSDLSDADLRDSVGFRIDIKDNKLTGAKFSYPEALSLLSTLGIIIE